MPLPLISKPVNWNPETGCHTADFLYRTERLQDVNHHRLKNHSSTAAGPCRRSRHLNSQPGPLENALRWGNCQLADPFHFFREHSLYLFCRILGALHNQLVMHLHNERCLQVFPLQSLGAFLSTVGGPAAAGLMEETLAKGAEKILLFGACGVLDKSLAAGHLILPTAAYRDEGTSYHYLPPSDYVAMYGHPMLPRPDYPPHRGTDKPAHSGTAVCGGFVGGYAGRYGGGLCQCAGGFGRREHQQRGRVSPEPPPGSGFQEAQRIVNPPLSQRLHGR